MIHVVAIITAKSGMREAILKEFHTNMPAVHAEKGCIEYGPAVDAEGIGSFQAKFGPDTFVVIEKLARGSSPAGQKASPTAQASAGHSSKPSLVSTSTAYMNRPPMNSARVMSGMGARTYCCSRCNPSTGGS